VKCLDQLDVADAVVDGCPLSAWGDEPCGGEAP